MEKTEEEVAWEDEREVKIELVKSSDFEDVKQFLYEHFYPDEPLCKSLECLELNGWGDRAMLKETDKFMIQQPIESSQKVASSMIARCTKSGKIVGTRFGEVITKEDLPQIQKNNPKIHFLGNMPTWVPVPKKLRKWGALQEIFDALPTGQAHVFNHEETKDSNAIYFGHNVCVARSTRGKGLGKELVKRSHKLAEKAGCSHTYILATGMFSQRIFTSLDYKLIFEIKYADHEKDKRGRPLLHDHEPHVSIQTVLYKHEKQEE